MRGFGRLQWILPALGILCCVVGLSFAVQVVGFPRPASERLLTTQALRELLRYRAMRGVEQVGRHSVATTCLDGWIRVRARNRPIHGAFVLLANGERLYDLGNGVRRAGRVGQVGPIDRARFVLAGCPLFLGMNLVAELTRNLPVDADPFRAHSAQDVAISLAPREGVIQLIVGARSFRPVELVLRGPPRGSSRLEPGASPATVARMQRAFGLVSRREASSV